MLAPKPASYSPSTTTTKPRRRDMTTATAAPVPNLRRLPPPQPRKQHQPQTPSPKIWRTRAQLETLSFAPLTAHKMSSVGNAFASDDLYGSFDGSVRSIAEDGLPEAAMLLAPQHTEVLRSSPLSIAEADEVFVVGEQICSALPAVALSDAGGLMTWNQKGNQWISLTYRYVFPASAFDVPESTRIQKPIQSPPISKLPASTAFSPHRKQRSASTAAQPSFAFPPPQESIMMGSGSLTPAFAKEQISSEAEAREACQKLLQLIDDEALMLPLMRSSLESLKSAAEAQQSAVKPSASAGNKTLRSLHSEWSSLPSSPPPPIFHDGSNRPIPELRLSPPMTAAKQGKKLFAALHHQQQQQQNAITESPLTKRLRMSSSASSSSLI